jgi:predicted  nucleic acid-binding Zn-ribbon protein
MNTYVAFTSLLKTKDTASEPKVTVHEVRDETDQVESVLEHLALKWVWDEVGKNNFENTLAEDKPLKAYEANRYVLKYAENTQRKINVYWMTETLSGWFASGERVPNHLGYFEAVSVGSNVYTSYESRYMSLLEDNGKLIERIFELTDTVADRDNTVAALRKSVSDDTRHKLSLTHDKNKYLGEINSLENELEDCKYELDELKSFRDELKYELNDCKYQLEDCRARNERLEQELKSFRDETKFSTRSYATPVKPAVKMASFDGVVDQLKKFDMNSLKKVATESETKAESVVDSSERIFQVYHGIVRPFGSDMVEDTNPKINYTWTPFVSTFPSFEGDNADNWDDTESEEEWDDETGRPPFWHKYVNAHRKFE